MRRSLRGTFYIVSIPAGLIFLLSSCSLGYYMHTASGQLDLLSRREPIQELLADPSAADELKAKLGTVLQIRDFASSELGLPDNDSYRSYADIERPYVVWNVFAAPEFSIDSKQWCFPVVGCVTYRGYFARAKADRFAQGLEDDGYDVYVGGVPAYSTLGRFDDPVMNTMLHWEEADLAAIIFHELAHQRLYVKGDAPFSEAFAMLVEEEGLRLWVERHGTPETLEAYRLRRQREGALFLLAAETRERLRVLYGSAIPEAEMRERKAAEFQRLRGQYESMKASWGGYARFDHWFNEPLNNARLGSLATYRQFLPAFRTLLHRAGSELETFYVFAEHDD
jgi:predicted aminopeptidase